MAKKLFKTPDQLIAMSKDHLVMLDSQKNARMQVASLISMHLAKIDAMNAGVSYNDLPCVSAFIIGGTGSGKTYTISQLCKCAGIGSAVIDATSLTPSGYKGVNIGAALKGVVTANKDFNEGFIVIIDEADKLFFTGNGNADSKNVQQELLKLFEGGIYSVDDGDNSILEFDISRTMIILCGACTRLNKNNMRISGFTGHSADFSECSDATELVTLEDLISIGMHRELASRVNTIVHFNTLASADYIQLIDGEGNTAKKKYEKLFSPMGLDFEISLDAAVAIADECIARNVGARSITSILSENIGESLCCLSDRSINGIVIKTEAGKLKIEYKRGKRKITVEGDNYEYDAYIANCITTDIDVENLATKMLRFAGTDNNGHKKMIYHFLLCTLNYLRFMSPEDEKTVNSLSTIAETTYKEVFDPNCLSPFDVMMQEMYEVISRKRKPDKFVNYYYEYKHYEVPTSKFILISAISNIRRNLKYIVSGCF